MVSIFFILSLYIIFFSFSVATDTLKPTQSLSGNQTLISSGGQFALGFFSPPNSPYLYLGIWYHNIPLKTIAWVANRDSPLTDLTGTLTLTVNSSLIITNHAGAIIWSTPPTTILNPVATLLDNGNLVVTDSSSSTSPVPWQSFDHPTDTLLASMRIGVDSRRKISSSITSWKSASDPSTGDYSVGFDFNGDPEMFLWAANRAEVWRTGPWDGLQFSGIPDTTSYQNFSFSYISDDQETSYSFDVTDPSIISRLVVNYTGVVQRSVWIDDGRGDWNYFWYAPRDQCDGIGACGAYGVCDPNNSPICDCMQGFEPRYPANWALRDGSGGCVRKTMLDCRNGTDGFATVSGAKLPDTGNCTVDRGMSLDECRNSCLSNCSCTGYAAANVSGGGSGCVIWVNEMVDVRVYTDSGQDLYVRLAAADLVSTASSTRRRHPTIAIVVSVLLAAVLLIGAANYLWRKKRKIRGFSISTSLNDHYQEESSRGNDLDLPLFDMETIIAATGNFSFGNKLGEGGFGPVYKGILRGEQEIAVKRLGKTSIQGLDEFKNEVVLIAKLQHRNLVRLLGCCVEGAERMLIYEYMPNRSLDAFLFDKARAMLLVWQTRYNIIAGIARGLLYLHQDSRLRIIHRDLKASNILLDQEMIPKISDFGMARIFGGDETEANTRRIVGTYGYMSPEYAMDGIFSVKSDVFSFGVLVLEVISGKKNRGASHTFPHVNLLGHAWSLWHEGNSLQLLDESIDHSVDTNEVLKCINIGLLCVQEHPEDRPLMSNVVLMLASDNVSLPHPKPPGFALRRFPFEPESSSSKNESSSHNDMSFTMFEGR